MFIQLIRRSSILITGQFFYFNTFSLAEFISPHPDSDLSQAGIQAFKTLFGREPRTFKWDFCTNGVATAGRLNIATIGFGPGDSKKAHTTDECCEIDEIAAAAQFYAHLPNYL